MMKTRSGFIAIVGRPNVGKSTLLNQLIGEKVAITSDKPQTTRHRISGIYTKDDTQTVFVDTPGMHKAKDLLNKRMDQTAVQTLRDVDGVIFMVDRMRGASETHIIKYFESIHVPVFLVINKIDTLKNKSEIDEIIMSYLNVYDFKAYIPISAKEQTHIPKLLEEIDKILVEGPFYYPIDAKSDQSQETMMAELIREKILYHTEEEVPHAVFVQIESLKYNKKLKTLDATAIIIVERTTQKLILIGKNGEKIKKIGMEARKDINRTLDLKVHLELWVKVKKDWRNKESDLKLFGLGDDV